MLILQDILSQEIVQRLGWTLLHFIWQAAAVALILAILLRLLQKSTANLRYIIACLALALIVLLPVITIKLVPVSKSLKAAHFYPAPTPTVLPTVEMPAPETIVIAKPSQPESVNVVPAIPFKQRAADTLEPALPYIVSGWLIGVFGLSIWHLGGWTQLQRLKRRMVKQVDSTLLNKLKVLAQRLRVNQTLQIVESALVQIPTVVGWLRPVILLPASALTGLSSEQLEAILAHELAHIKRVDYLLNILQTVVEILGFYHPAVWWVSHKIRAERENCCDDLAVAISGDRVCYARALTSMEEIRAGQGQLAVAAAGGNLFRRIYRLVGKDSAQKTPSSWIPAATAILLIIALAIPTTLALTTQSDTQKNGQETDAQVDEEPPAVEVISANENLEILGIEFEPIHQGKNEVNIKVRNKTEKEQIFGTNIITLSPDEYGKHGIGWGSLGSFEVIQPQNTETVRFVYKIERPVNDNTWVWLILYNPLTQENLEQEHFFEKRFYSSDLEHSSTEILDAVPVSQNQTSAVHEAFRKIQDNIRNQEYEKVWELCTEDYKIAEFHGASDDGFGIFKDTMEQTESGANMSKWDKREFLDLQPEKVSYHDGIFYLSANYNEQHWLIHFKMEDSQYKIDWIDGYTPRFLKEEIERQRVLSAENLKQLGLAVAMYADDHDKKLPDTLEPLKPYIANEQDFLWIVNNVEYICKNETYLPNQPRNPVAYDKTQKEKQSGANVLFMDGHVEFLTPQRLSELDIKRAKFLIEAWFLAVSKDFLQNINHNANPPDEAEVFFILTSELLAASGGWKTQSFIIDERNVSLVLEAVQTHKDFKVLSSPQLICQEDKTAQIRVLNNETYSVTGYTEPNRPSEKSDPKFDKVEEGISLSVTPKLTPYKYIDMQFEFEIIQFLEFEERKLKGKAPKVEKITQALRYIAKDGQAFLFGGHKIADRQDNQTEQKDLLVLIKAQTIGSSEQDKPAKTENLIVAEPPRITTNVITQPAIAKSRTEIPKDNEQEKTKPQIEVKKVLSDQKLKQLGLAVAMYAEDHNDNLPESIQDLIPYIRDGQDFDWLRDNVVYLNKGKSAQRNASRIPIAYDRTMPEKANGTNVLFLDFSVRFLDTEECEKLDINIIRTEFLIEARFLSVSEDFLKSISLDSNSPDEAQSNLRLTPEVLKSLDVSENQILILDEQNTNSLIVAVRAHKDSKVLAAPQVICQEDKTAEIRVFNNVAHYITGYTEPNRPSEKPQPKFDKVEESIYMSLKPKLTRNKNIYMDFELEITQVPGFEERMYKGKYPYKHFTVENTTQATSYTAKNGQTLLCAGNKITKQKDGRTEQKDLLILITTHTVGSSENDKSAKTENLIVTEPPRITIDGITQPKIAKSRSERRKDNEQEKTKEHEQKPSQVQAKEDYELPEISKRIESAKKLSSLGKALLIYANDNDNKYPNSLPQLREYLNEEDFHWSLSTVEYLATGKTLADRPDTVIAYDKKLLAKVKGTNVLYNDCHVGFEKVEKLKKLGIGDSKILFKTKLLSVSEDFLKDVGLDADSEDFSNAWAGHLAAKYPAGPNGQPYGLIIDDLHVSFLLKAVHAHKDSKVLAAPQVLCLEGRTAQISIMTEEYYYVKGYNEPNSPSDKPQQKLDKVEIGTHLWLKPILTPDNENVDLDFKLENSQLKGITEGKYKGKYPFQKPIIDVISAKMPCTIPDGKTMLIGGLKIIEQIKKEPGALQLRNLPLIGAVFSSKDKIKDQKMLLILVKPITNPQQKATKLLPGQKDSEEHIKRLAEQLEKKINPPNKPK